MVLQLYVERLCKWIFKRSMQQVVNQDTTMIDMYDVCI